MSNLYRTFLDLSYTSEPTDRRQNISKEIVRHADYLPKTLTYKDIDNAFKEWVEKNVNIVQDGIKLPTMVLYSNQRFSEYMQSWKFTDENNNIRLNFKTITRENNPAHGTILNDTFNIPGKRFYTMRSIIAVDDSGKKYKIEYKMRQPTSVDLIYKVSILTNKYTSINEFNELVQHLFNARQQYICPNGHYISITVEGITDDSEYKLDDRQFFSQTFTAKVKGYIIREEDLKVEQKPFTTVLCFEGDTAKRRKPTIELNEYDPCFDKESGNYNKNIEIDVDFSFCYPNKGKTKFTMDDQFILTDIKFKEPNNIVEDNIKLYINDEIVSTNLLKDAYEGYVKCDTKPEDANKKNTTTYDDVPIVLNKLYKYIIFNGEYYKWHQIMFNDGDEIIVETKKINRIENTGGFTLIGYNKF